MEIGSTRSARTAFEVAADFYAFALGVPALMIVSGYEVCGDSLADRKLVDHVIELVIHAWRREEFRLVEADLSVDPVARVEHMLNADALEVIVGGIEHIETRVFAAQMVVGCNAVDALHSGLGFDLEGSGGGC